MTKICKKIAFLAGAAVLPFTVPSVAYAQDAATSHPYFGVQIGHHDLGLDTD